MATAGNPTQTTAEMVEGVMDGSVRNRQPFSREEDRLNPWVTWRSKSGFLVDRQGLRGADVNRHQSRLLELSPTDREEKVAAFLKVRARDGLAPMLIGIEGGRP